MSFFSIMQNGYKSKKPPACTAVIAAAGISKRCRGEDKLFYNINGKPVLAHTLEAFQNCELIDDIIVVTREERYESIGELCLEYGFNKVSKVIKGGLTRPESVINGIYAASSKARLIAVHDGARPCIDTDIIERTMNKAAKYHAAAPAVAITSTTKKAEDGVIIETVDRNTLYEIQTPQIFKTEIIKGALTNVIRKEIDITDDCMAVEVLGVPVHLTDGSRRNIKITQSEDLLIAEALLNPGNQEI